MWPYAKKKIAHQKKKIVPKIAAKIASVNGPLEYNEGN
jgi:hypothetical protein